MFPGFNFGFGNEQPRQRQPPRNEEDPFTNLFGQFAGNQPLAFPGFEMPSQQPQERQRNQRHQQQPRHRPQQQQNRRQNNQHRQPNENSNRQNTFAQAPQQKAPVPQQEMKPEPPQIGSAQYWKDKGNEAFGRNDIQAAIDCYTQAIGKDSSESVYFSNRSRCYKMLGRYEEAAKDAQTAIDLDEKNIKAHLISGQILAELGKHDEDTRRIEAAIVRLTKALTLCSGQRKKQYEDQLTTYINRAKKLKWYKQRELRQAARRKAIAEYSKCLESSMEQAAQSKQAKVREFEELMKLSCEEPTLHIPDSFFCKITLDVMKQPYMTEAGHSYQRSAIEQHLKNNGAVDPVARQPLKSSTIYPNIALKAAIESFVDSNPWAYEFSEHEDFRKIQF